jgi:hypothetical protein
MRRTRLVILAANGTRDRHSRPRYRPVRQGGRAGHFPESTERGWAIPHQVDWGEEERQGKGSLGGGGGGGGSGGAVERGAVLLLLLRLSIKASCSEPELIQPRRAWFVCHVR